jgi:beta-lactamase class A
MPASIAVFLFLAHLIVCSASAGTLDHRKLQQSLQELVHGFPARAGVCAMDQAGSSCVNGKSSFSLQSVMKLVVSLAALQAADDGRLNLDDPAVIHRQDLSLYVQPLAKLVGEQGFHTTARDLIHRAIVDSDSAAADILVRRLGGPPRIQAFLKRKGIEDIRIDRDERHLQTEIVGLTWRPEYVDPATLDKAMAAVPATRKDRAYREYQTDPRDTATPFGLATLLRKLAEGKLLSPMATRYALDTMAQTVTFPDRLKAGVPPGWRCMHKTGTSGSWKGVTAATNDVGIFQAPDQTYLSIAVFIADTAEPIAVRDRLMQRIAAATTAAFH